MSVVLGLFVLKDAFALRAVWVWKQGFIDFYYLLQTLHVKKIRSVWNKQIDHVWTCGQAEIFCASMFLFVTGEAWKSKGTCSQYVLWN